MWKLTIDDPPNQSWCLPWRRLQSCVWKSHLKMKVVFWKWKLIIDDAPKVKVTQSFCFWKSELPRFMFSKSKLPKFTWMFSWCWMLLGHFGTQKNVSWISGFCWICSSPLKACYIDFQDCREIEIVSVDAFIKSAIWTWHFFTPPPQTPHKEHYQ